MFHNEFYTIIDQLKKLHSFNLLRKVLSLLDRNCCTQKKKWKDIWLATMSHVIRNPAFDVMRPGASFIKGRTTRRIFVVNSSYSHYFIRLTKFVGRNLFDETGSR